MTLIVDLSRDARPGFRLERLEVLNWGTFDGHVWGLDLLRENALLTGDIGSGKSTLVDAITTLLVPPGRLSYNKAAGAEARERTLKSYVLGHFKSERSETGSGAKAVSLRTHDSYSVILARFVNEGFSQHVTLAQVFWMKEVEAQPARMFVIADELLSIAKHFGDFGTDISDLRKRLRRARFEIFDSFPPYASAFRRRFGIENEQALDLFHQTVSMKSVGNLTEFVRQHMLEAFPVEPRIVALISHFDDLNRAHEAVLKAKAQIEKLEPLIADCGRHTASTHEADTLRACRDALRPWFARRKGALLEQRLDKLQGELQRLDVRIQSLETERHDLQLRRDELQRAIFQNGGDRIEQIKREVGRKREELSARQTRERSYAALASALGLPPASDADSFVSNRRASQGLEETTTAHQVEVQNERTEQEVHFQVLRGDHEQLERELDSLRKRRSNIPARMLELRAKLCEDLDIEEGALPFAGEVLQVREDERDWEGAIERLVHTFGLSMLVPDDLYPTVADYVDRVYLGGRLVYYRVRSRSIARTEGLGPSSLVHKLAIKPDSQFYDWIEVEVARRFDYACCQTVEQFRREVRAITRSGQIKGAGERHEKDDRHRLDDRSRYVLGWSNEAKIATLERQQRGLVTRMADLADKLEKLKQEQASLIERLGKLREIAVYGSFRDLDWKPLAREIDALEREQKSLEAESDVLRGLQSSLSEVEEDIMVIETKLSTNTDQRGKTRAKQEEAERQLDVCNAIIGEAPDAAKARFESLDVIVDEVLAGQTLTVECCEAREKDVRESLQKKIDREDRRLRELGERIVQAMRDYCRDYPLETRETDSKVEAQGEYQAMLERLRTDDLPRFESRFKELLNENTIREVANFQSQLHRERQGIKERIETINGSLRGIDYNPGRYIVLEATPSTDAEIRDFQQDLRACTEGALTGSEDDAYSEAKFQKVKRIIERFRGREGSSELDARWTRKVTDVRNWFGFSASERWREGDVEHEHYTDSGGKSGGQKEKLAYTVLAASLAYQFGLEAGASASRTFRFVVIDEAFGRGSDESSRYGLELFGRLGLQLLIVTPLQKIHVIEPYVAGVGFVHNEGGRSSMLRNLTIEQYREERALRGFVSG